MIRHDTCPVCTSVSISLFLRCMDHLVSREYFELYRCSRCSMVFTRAYPTETDIEKYYESEDYISHHDNAKGLINTVYLLVRKIMSDRKISLVRQWSGIIEGKILDIGCGTGYFASVMSKGGWKTTGIEINKKARDFAISHFGLNVIDPGAISLLPAESFDVITLWHVLEHFHDPSGYFNEIRRLLKNDGICVVALPNNLSYDAEYYREYWAAYDVPRHLWHFTPGSFGYFSEKAGFRCLGKSALPFDVFYISALSEKNMGKRFPFIKGMLRGIVFYLRSVINKEKQSSFIYLLRKMPV